MLFRSNFRLRYDGGNKIFRILDSEERERHLVVDINRQSKKEVVFGSDILNNGAVIQINQNDNNLAYYSNGKLILNVTSYIDQVSQIDDLKIVYKISNIKGSRSSKRFPGVRIQVVPYSEIGRNYIVGKYKNSKIGRAHV